MYPGGGKLSFLEEEGKYGFQAKIQAQGIGLSRENV
jgi:hypothetical protein